MEKLPKGRAVGKKCFKKCFSLFAFKLKRQYWRCYQPSGKKNQCAAAVSHILSLNIGNQQNVKDICCKSVNNTIYIVFRRIITLYNLRIKLGNRCSCLNIRFTKNEEGKLMFQLFKIAEILGISLYGRSKVTVVDDIHRTTL